MGVFHRVHGHDGRRACQVGPKDADQAQQTALKLVENAKDGKYSGSERLARYVFDREEGKARQKVKIEGEVPVRRELSDEELRELMQEKLVDCEDAIAS